MDFNGWFHNILGIIIIPTDFHSIIFQRARWPPPTSDAYLGQVVATTWPWEVLPVLSRKIPTESFDANPSRDFSYMGVSENSVPLNPMVNDHYPYYINGYNWEYTLFSDKPISHLYSL